MSAGFFGFFAHAGFMAALEDAGIAPSGASGSSAGALVTGLWASGRSATELSGRLLELRRHDFWDPGLGAGLLRGDLFSALLDELLGADTFEACRAPLSVSVFDVAARRTEVRSRGALAPAIQASCTFPGLFHPVRIDGRTYIDGGVADRSGLMGIADGRRVLYHHLSSRSTMRKRFKRLSWYPRRAGMLPVIVNGLPRVGPFKLERGRLAFETARTALRLALDRPAGEIGGAPNVICAG